MTHDSLKYPGDISAAHDEATGHPTAVEDPIVTPEPEPAPDPNRPPRLSKRKSLEVDRDTVVKHVLKNFDADLQERIDWSEVRVQRYAKLRGWLEVKNYPWPNAANCHIPDLMTDSLRTQDTLHNAVLSQRPVMSAKALKPHDAGKGEQVDDLLDYQLFIEQNGEEKIGDFIDGFVNDGLAIAYIPWVRDDRRISDVRTLAPIPSGMDPMTFVLEQLERLYPRARFDYKGKYHWIVETNDAEGREQVFDVRVYEEDASRLQVVSEGTVRIYEGPCFIPKALEDVVVPARSTNCQAPGPSNPGGAPHLILVDYPDRDEILRLYQSGYYDLMTADEAEALQTEKESKLGMAQDPQAMKAEKDALAGQIYGKSETAKASFTRLTVYERWDVDGDGLLEDVIFWIIKEPRMLVKARYMTEMFPSNPPRRPVAEARFIPVPGEFYAIGLLELMEHVHDTMKIIFDQMIDSGTLANTPWGLYRVASGMRPETIRMTAGELYPTSNPKEDIFFPQTSSGQGQAWALNMMTVLGQMQERLTMVGELQLGRVPYGKASALRTSSTTQSILQQGDARPERILRRFFRGLSEVYQQMHELNQAFLPPKKVYRVLGIPEKGNDPYRVVEDPSQIRGRFLFDFQANVLNTNKAMQAQIMQQMMAAFINPLMMQSGLVDKDKIYRMAQALAKALGQDPDTYLNRPSEDATLPVMTANEALARLMEGIPPDGKPAEGWPAHLQLIQAFQSDPRFMLMNAFSRELYHHYVGYCMQRAQQEQQLMQHAADFAQQQNGGGGAGGPDAMPPNANGQAPVQPNELMNEALPTSGGGAMGAGAR